MQLNGNAQAEIAMNAEIEQIADKTDMVEIQAENPVQEQNVTEDAAPVVEDANVETQKPKTGKSKKSAEKSEENA
jgi:hypothetical protein